MLGGKSLEDGCGGWRYTDADAPLTPRKPLLPIHTEDDIAPTLCDRMAPGSATDYGRGVQSGDMCLSCLAIRSTYAWLHGLTRFVRPEYRRNVAGETQSPFGHHTWEIPLFCWLTGPWRIGIGEFFIWLYQV